MKKFKRILLIDCSAVLHAVKFGAPKKLKSGEKSTFVIFGFLQKLRYLQRRTYSDVIVFAGDSLRSDSLRKKWYSIYKDGRDDAKKTPEQIELDRIAMPQFNEVLEDVLPGLGYNNIFRFKGFEADDIIAKVCKKYKKAEIVIVTSDKDMYQLLTDNVCIMHPSTHTFFTKKDFRTKYELHPKMWKRVKSMAGCDSDNVKGIPGIGEKTVLQYLKGELPTHYKKYKDIKSKEGKKITDRNKKLVIIPYKGTPDIMIEEDRVTGDKIKKVAKKYNKKNQ